MWATLLTLGVLLGASEEAPQEISAAAVPEAAPAVEASVAPVAEPSAPQAELGMSGLAALATDAYADNKLWHVRADGEFHKLVIQDPTPRADMYLLWRMRGDVQVIKGGRAFVSFGLQEKFWAEQDDSALRLTDTQVGFSYNHALALDGFGIGYFEGKKLELSERARVFLPTSRASANQDLYFSPDLLGRARFEALPGFAATVDLFFRYYVNKYAEQAGQQGGMLNQLMFGPNLNLEYSLYEHPVFGAVGVGADVSSSYFKRYASRDEFESDLSSQTFWYQEYGWDAYVSYVPIPQLVASLVVSQGGPVLRDGIVNMFFAKREETEWALTLTATY